MNVDAQSNVDPAELAKFGRESARWWDPEGPFKALHDINPLRVEYIGARATLDGARVLDVGCGGGLLCEALLEQGAHVTGLDRSPESVQAARAHAASRSLDIDYVEADALEYAEQHRGEFDIVTCLELLEHVPRPDEIVTACALALRPGGDAFFSTINRNPKSFLLAIVTAEYLLDIVPRGTHEYLKLIRPSELAGWLRHSDLDLRELTGMHLNPLTRRFWLGGNVDVNYLCHARKPEATP